MLHGGAAALLCLACAVGYMAFWVPWRRGAPVDDYNAVTPRAIHAALALCFLSFLLLLLALWPVYHLATPVLLAVLSMAAILSPNLIPSLG